MAVLASHPTLLFRNPRNTRHSFKSPCFSTNSILFRSNSSTSSPPFRTISAISGEQSGTDPIPGQIPAKNPPQNDDIKDKSDEGSVSASYVDEWGEKTEPEAESAYTKLSEVDPPKDEDEWGGEEAKFDFSYGNGAFDGSSGGVGATATAAVAIDDKLADLKMCLADTVYGTDYGFRTTAEVRAEVVELISQLEAANPTSVPTEASSLLDGNWILLYTAFSELLPLIAAGTSPLLKLKRICQAIDTRSFTIQNSVTYSSPFATFSFSASASFEVRTATRIQVKFQEGIVQPPEISTSVDLPENIDIFGQKIDLSPLQRSLNPLQEAVASISRTISGQPPLKIPIPGERTESWLLITYLDEDLRISRGDGGLFVLVKEGSPLLNR